MNFSSLLQIVSELPTFETGLLLSGDANPMEVRKQLSRWTNNGKIYQLRRGLYSLVPPYQKVSPHPFLTANQIKTGSYVSLQSALSYYGLIPEYVPVTTSVSTGRTDSYQTPLGQFDYRHIQVEWFLGYDQLDLGNGQTAFVAKPEKALLDLIYLQAGGETEGYLRSLRLQSLDQINKEQLRKLAGTAGKPKLLRSLGVIEQLIDEEATGYESL